MDDINSPQFRIGALQTAMLIDNADAHVLMNGINVVLTMLLAKAAKRDTHAVKCPTIDDILGLVRWLSTQRRPQLLALEKKLLLMANRAADAYSAGEAMPILVTLWEGLFYGYLEKASSNPLADEAEEKAAKWLSQLILLPVPEHNRVLRAAAYTLKYANERVRRYPHSLSLARFLAEMNRLGQWCEFIVALRLPDDVAWALDDLRDESRAVDPRHMATLHRLTEEGRQLGLIQLLAARQQLDPEALDTALAAFDLIEAKCRKRV